MKPIIKWAGGKAKLLPLLHPLLPGTGFTRYVEPFFGGGAMGFSLDFEKFPGQRIYADANADLMLFYDAIVTAPTQVAGIAHTFAVVHDSKAYLDVRALYNAMLPFRLDGHRGMTAAMHEVFAGAFLYLNKCGFNGLYRVNDKGEFNVAPNPEATWSPSFHELCVQLSPAATHLRKCTLFPAGFDNLFRTHTFGLDDFIFCDPPYVSDGAGFTGYTKEDFNLVDLKLLSEHLKASGAKWMLTHRDTQLARQLFKGFHITEVRASRLISCKGSTRLPVTELVIRNYE